MAMVQLRETKDVPVKYLKAECGVRYWEDGEVNGVEDEDGSLIPFRVGDAWCPVIDLDAGKVEDWPEGVSAKTHYKVCDDGRYTLLDAHRNEIVAIDGYVPNMLGGGDYVILSIGPDGAIENWRVDLEGFAD